MLHDFSRILPEMTLSRFAALQWLSFAVVVAVLMYLLSPILTPFVAAGILAYICNPLVQRLCAWKIPRTLAVLLVMSGLLLLFALLLLIMLPLLEKEISRFVTRLPDWIEAARTHLLPLLQQWFGADLQWDSQAVKNLLLSHSQERGRDCGKTAAVARQQWRRDHRRVGKSAADPGGDVLLAARLERVSGARG